MEKVKTLSKQETRVMVALSYGNLYKEIADDYDISINTVKKHLKNIYKKLEVESRKQAVAKFFEQQRLQQLGQQMQQIPVQQSSI